MMRTANIELTKGRYEPIERDIERIERLTLAEVREEAGRLFGREEELSLIAVVPEQEQNKTTPKRKAD